MTAIIPVNISFQGWCGQLRNSYPGEDIPDVVLTEEEWNLFPSMLLSNGCFNNSFIPFAAGFSDWRNWASQFLLSIGA